MCLNGIKLGLGSLGENGSFGLPYVFFVPLLNVFLASSHFGFEVETLVLTAPVPGHCLCFSFCLISSVKWFFKSIVISFTRTYLSP